MNKDKFKDFVDGLGHPNREQSSFKFSEHYKLDTIEFLANGSFGSVYKVFSILHDKEIAIKIELFDAAVSFNAATLFVRISELTKLVSNLKAEKVDPFVVDMYDYFWGKFNDEMIEEIRTFNVSLWKKIVVYNAEFDENVNFPYTFGITEMQLIKGGGTLRDLTYGKYFNIDGNDQKKIEECRSCIFQLVYSSFAMQHSLELAHFDLKDENILIEKSTFGEILAFETPGKGRFKLKILNDQYKFYIADFGMSRLSNFPAIGTIPDDIDETEEYKFKKALSDATLKKFPVLNKNNSNWNDGTRIYFHPIYVLLFPTEDYNVPVRGPEDDIWILGNIMCSIMLNGWKLPENDAGVKEFNFVTLCSLFHHIKPKIETEIEEETEEVPAYWYKPALDLANDIISDIKFKTGDQDKAILPERLVWIMAICQFQYYIGLRFLPDVSTLHIIGYGNYRGSKWDGTATLGIIGMRLKKAKEQILNMGRNYINGNGDRKNIFELARDEIIRRYGHIGLEFLKRHLGWNPEDRRYNPISEMERGSFLAVSLLNPFFRDMNLGEMGFNEYKISKNVWSVKNDSLPNTRLLGNSIDPKRIHYLCILNNGIGMVMNRMTRRPNCTHTIDSGSLIKWNREKKSIDHVCPLCHTFSNNQIVI